MKSLILVRNLEDKEGAKRIESALSETRVDFAIDIEKKCVIIEGNSDMVPVARKILTDLGFSLL